MTIKNIFRKSRFHDEKGNRVDFFGMLYLPLALGGAVLRYFFNYRPLKPTISFRATKVIDGILQPHFKCVEFGSGMSTVWISARCQFLLSRENNDIWFKKINHLISKRRCSNIKYEFSEGKSFSCLDEYENGYFDFAFIDGWDRAGCALSVLPKLKKGGWLYLDNSDKDMTVSGGDLRRAERLIVEYVKNENKEIRYFVVHLKTETVILSIVAVGDQFSVSDYYHYPLALASKVSYCQPAHGENIKIIFQ